MATIKCLTEYHREPALVLVGGRVLVAERVYFSHPDHGPSDSWLELCEVKKMTVTVAATMKDGQTYSGKISVSSGIGGVNRAISIGLDPDLWAEDIGPINHLVAAIGRRILRHFDAEAGCLVY